MTLTIVTPSYANDFRGFARLHESVLRHTDPSVTHIAVVPEADLELFRSIRSPRLDVRSERAVLPRRFMPTTALARIPKLPRGYRVAAINVRRPFPPIRGWILQQIVKLALTSELDADVALLVDSDVLLIRPVQEEHFVGPGGAVRLYRTPHGIDASRPRPRRWLQTARDKLGISEAEPDQPDYISSFTSWDPRIVRSCVSRISDVAGRDWRDVLGACLDFSEFLLYGTYVMALAPPTARQNIGETSLCHSHWDPVPLDADGARAFLDGVDPDDLAVHIQSNSHTDEAVLDAVARRFAASTS
ncbi:DUF6492 family protein [Microbacterium aurum]